ncbi:MAG: hypothetical protein AAF957_14700 [Planctomycetota bacterium]
MSPFPRRSVWIATPLAAVPLALVLAPLATRHGDRTDEQSSAALDPSIPSAAELEERYAAWNDDDLLIALEALRATYTDAMSEVAWAKYRAGECVSANTRAARAHHDDHGRPIAIFTDGATGSHFRVTVEQDESMEAHALLAELAWLTQRCKQRGLVLE